MSAPGTDVHPAGGPAATGESPNVVGTAGGSTSGLAPWNTTIPTRAPRSRRRTVARLVLLVLAGALAVGLLAQAVAGPRGAGGPLDPDDTGRGGARAVAEVLREQGVDVSVVRSIDDLERTLDSGGARDRWTVTLTDASYLGSGAAERLSRAVEQTRRFVLVEPDDVELEDLALPLTVAEQGTAALAAGCATDLADAPDRLAAGWSSYTVSTGAGQPRSGGGAQVCFPSDPSRDSGSTGAGAVVVLPADGAAPETVVLGSARALSNGQVLDAAHAALALRTLGRTEHLLWYVPGVSDLDAVDPSGGPAGDPSRGVPPWLTPAALLLAAAVVALALARGRRLGPLVVEPLPVVVRAAETTEARGRLYHRAADRPVAAQALRLGSRARIADRLGLPGSTPGVALVAAATRASGIPTADVERLLDGPDPTNDRDLLLLAQRLADLEESVRHA